MRRLGTLFLLLVGLCAVAMAPTRSLSAQESSKKASDASTTEQSSFRAKAKVKQGPIITPEREAVVMAFVEQNHAELAVLLAHLKDNQPREYERAIRELFRVTERLAQMQERDPVQYELELALWTAQSQVQLLAAKSKMGASETIREELRAALGVQADAKLALLKHDQQRAKARLERLEKDIAAFTEGREATIEKQLSFLTREPSRPVSKSGKKGAARAKKGAE